MQADLDSGVIKGRKAGERWPALISIASICFHAALEVGGSSHPAVDPLSASFLFVALLAMARAMRSPYAKSLWYPRWVRNPPLLDERERAIIAFAHARSYEILVGGIFLLLAYLAVSAWVTSLWIPDTRQAVRIVFAVGFAAGMLPVTLAEWTIAAPDPDDD